MTAPESFVPIVEEITFRKDGGSHHVWRLADGSVFKEEDFKVSPVMFRKSNVTTELETANDRGLVSIKRVMK